MLFRVLGHVRYEILGQKEARANEEIGCRAATGAFGPHDKGSISWFSPLWIAAPLTMKTGGRPASCQMVSTPFSATLWPTPRSPLRLHSLETGFCVVGKQSLWWNTSSIWAFSLDVCPNTFYISDSPFEKTTVNTWWYSFPFIKDVLFNLLWTYKRNSSCVSVTACEYSYRSLY